MARTTVRLDDALLEQAHREARRRRETLTSLIERSLRRELARDKGESPPAPVLPIFESTGGLMPGVDLDNSAALLDILEPPEEIRKRLGLK